MRLPGVVECRQATGFHLPFALLSLLLIVFSMCTVSFAGDLELSSLTSTTGFRIRGAATNDRSSLSVSTAGDINGDGIDDIIVGGLNSIAYIIFGKENIGAIGDIQLPTTTMDASVGFRVLGVSGNDLSGYCVSAAGDVNGDGIGDIIIGAPNGNPSAAGISYVIFGRNVAKSGAAPVGDIQLPNSILPVKLGFRILGAAAGDESGSSVSGAGDVNGDGIDDVIVSTHKADPPAGESAGVSYVIYGKNLSVPSTSPFGDIQLPTSSMSMDVGFRILGAAANDLSGFCVSKAGDINKDGFDDVLVGAPQADPLSGSDAGIAYLVFGSSSRGDVQLTTGSNIMGASVGFRILGAVNLDRNGWSVSAAGDVNDDGVDDFMVGAYEGDVPALGVNSNTGIVYVIFGRDVLASGTPFTDIQLTSSAMPASVGFRILGSAIDDGLGSTVSNAGDTNGDGIDDIIVGARFADLPARGGAGVSYVIFGRDLAAPGAVLFDDIYLPTFGSALPDSVGFRILGVSPDDSSGWTVSAAGDINDDGLADVIVGANYADFISGISYVVFGVSTQPTKQPTSQPSAQPSRQPTLQPSHQPSGQPSMQPTTQPSSLPTSQPSRQPSAMPSTQPTCQPSQQPSLQPSSQPSCQPTGQPTTQPSGSPSTQPSTQPTRQPSTQPISEPSSQPSCHPSVQPTVSPSGQPSQQPSEQPTDRPSGQPSTQPSSQPSTRPSTQPSQQPSRQPSCQPSTIPSVQPTLLPTSQPTTAPSTQPSVQPSTQPVGQPTSLPSSQPSTQPSTRPSTQPVGMPSGQPSLQPTAQPTQQPNMQPSGYPSAQPSVSPSCLPSAQPSRQPSAMPSAQPSGVPSAQPSEEPSRQPSSQPSGFPSAQPSSQPTIQPSRQPSSQPTCTPRSQPSPQPSMQPSQQPSSSPTLQPSASPTAFSGEWVHFLHNTTRMSLITYLNDQIWACGISVGQKSGGTLCVIVDPLRGTQMLYHSFPHINITSILSVSDLSGIMVSGGTTSVVSYNTFIGTCGNSINVRMTCTGKSFPRTSFTSASYVPAVDKVLYVGAFEESLFATVWNVVTSAFSSYIYIIDKLASIEFTQSVSPPNYVGSFLAGTCTSLTLANYICAGVVRTDSGTMTAMYLAPASSHIVNNGNLVNAMALEYKNPDSFIAGGLELSDGTGMHAYIVRVNSLYYSVLYAMRYRMRTAETSNRRALQEASITTSAVKGVVLVNTFLYMIVDYTEAPSTTTNVAVLLTAAATGHIVKQVQLMSPVASIYSNDITASGLYLTIICTIQSYNLPGQQVLISMDQDLTLSQLPAGFQRYENSTFAAERILFHRTTLPVSVEPVTRSTDDYVFTTKNEGPTLRPSAAPTSQSSAQPSSAPTGQPSSCPTAAPSVSPQPTSQPSSSGPTNTYKPTVTPTQRPSTAPSRGPTVSPTVKPTITPTARPSIVPSGTPTNIPSVGPTILLTRSPSPKPSRSPVVHPTALPTCEPSVTPTAVTSEVQSKAPSNDRAYLIVGYVAAGLCGLWLLYALRRWCQYKLEGVQSDANRTLYVESIADKPKPRFPICAYLVSLFITVEAVEVDFIHVSNGTKDTVVATTYDGVGANVEGLATFHDLEAHTTIRSKNTKSGFAQTQQEVCTSPQTPKAETTSVGRVVTLLSNQDLVEDQVSVQSDSQSDVDVFLSPESSYTDYAPSVSACSEEECSVEGGSNSGNDTFSLVASE